ncbi:MAG: hypothetical protein R2685_09780 [Candidatus Nitrosocosmicus sp.]|nr:hypothetical protein [Candidatus Nitrosocosmicus sp.]
MEKTEPLIKECLPIPQKLYKVTRRLKTREEVEEYFPGFMAFSDFIIEQSIPRLKNNRKKRRLYYSGKKKKKKKHTVKNLYTSNQKGLIIYTEQNVDIERYRRHDYKVYKKNHPKLPKEVMSMFDLGFLGVEKDYPTELKSSLPIKKERVVS